ncbi:MAG: hypothetical protein AB1813_11570 [Verrucomicrobiota bacterium]
MSEVLNQLVLQFNHGIVIRERVATELENELIPHGVFGSPPDKETA